MVRLLFRTQDEGAIKDGQFRENGRVHKTKGQSKMDNPETMAGRLVYPAIVSGLSIFDCPFVLCTLPFSLDCLSLISPSSCVPFPFLLWIIQRKWQGTQDEGAIKERQSRENGRVHKTKGCLSLIAPSSCVPCHFLWIVHL
jgi:hypothetical protein